MSPDRVYRRAGLDVDDLVGWSSGVRTAVACDIIGRHVSDWTIVARRSDTVRDRVRYAISLKLDEYRVRSC